MAWPRLRRHKPPGPPDGAGNVTAPDATARSRGASPAGRPGPGLPGSGSAASGAWPGADRPSWPPGEEASWPGADHSGHSGTGVDATESAAEAADVPFWEWAGVAEEPRDAAPRAADGPDGADSPAADADDRRVSGSWREPVVTPVASDGEPRRDGIGQRLGSLAHLSADPRMRGWQRRALIAVVVGVVFTIVVSWRLGLTLAVVAAIADTVYRSRTVFSGRPEVMMTAAQRHTRRQLARLRRAGYRAMHGSLIPGSADKIDHLVIGPAGVFAIDSEAWDKRMPVRTRRARQLWHGPYSMDDRLEHARWESEQAAELLSDALGSRVTVRPAMAIYGPKIPWDVATIRDVDVFSGPRLRKYLRRAARRGRGRLPDSEIERIAKAAQVAFPHLDHGAAR